MSRLTVNGRPVEFRIPADTPLLWALREASNLTGTKYGCDDGSCHYCTVIIDGEAIRSCLVTLAEVEGRFVTTIEGLSRDRGHPVQQAFVAANLPQCGYCTPGMVMQAAALIAKNADPDDGAIDAAISVQCRCGTYPRVRGAVKMAAAAARGERQVGAAPPPGIRPEDATRAVPSLRKPPAD